MVLVYVGWSGKALCKGPEIRACLECLKNIREASVAEMLSHGDGGKKGGH